MPAKKHLPKQVLYLTIHRRRPPSGEAPVNHAGLLLLFNELSVFHFQLAQLAENSFIKPLLLKVGVAQEENLANGFLVKEKHILGADDSLREHTAAVIIDLILTGPGQKIW